MKQLPPNTGSMQSGATPKSIRDLRRDTQHTHLGWSSQPWLFRQIRRASIYVTWMLLYTPLTPNAITLIAIAGGVVTAVLFALGWWIAGLIVLALVVVLDFSDGEVSRFRGSQSKEGSYLDKLYIFLVHPSPIAGMTIGVHAIYPSSWVLAAGFVDVISIFLLCMVNEYGRQLAVWKHIGRYLLRLENDPGFLASELKRTAAEPGAPDSASGVFRDSRAGSAIRRALAGWDFPYIFVFLAIAVLLQLAVGPDGPLSGIAPAKLYLYFYAVTYPPIICAMIAKNVASSVIEEDYRAATDQVIRAMHTGRRLPADRTGRDG